MKKPIKIKRKINKEDSFLKAAKNLRKIQKKINPLMKPKKYIEYSTAGEWCETSSLYS